MTQFKTENGKKFERIGNSWYRVTSDAELAAVNSRMPKQKALSSIPGLGSGFDSSLLLGGDSDYNKYIGWVYKAVSLVANGCASKRLRVYKRDSGEGEEILNHPVFELFEQPNPVQTRFDLWYLTWIYLLLKGNAYWYKAKNGLGVVGEIWPLRPDLVKVETNDNGTVKRFVYRAGGKETPFEPQEIIHLMFPNPLSLYKGFGPLQAATFLAENEIMMQKYNKYLYENKAEPGGVLETDHTLNETDVDRVRYGWEGIHQGVDNAGRTAILQMGLKYKSVAITNRELEFLASRKASKIDIFEMFGVPRTIAGIVEDVNRANADSGEFVFALYTILPYLTMMQERLTVGFKLEYGDVYFKYDNPVPKDKEFELKRENQDVDKMVMTINEVRETRNMEPVPWGDTPFIPFNLVQYGSGGTTTDDNKTAATAQLTAPNINKFNNKIEDENFRVTAWKRFDATAMRLVNPFQIGVKKLFKEQRADVLANLNEFLKSEPQPTRQKDTVDELLFDFDKWIEAFTQRMGAQFVAAVAAGAESTGDLIDGAFDINSPLVKQFIADKQFQFAFEVNTTTLDALKKELLTGLDSGEGIDKLTQRVKKIFTDAETFRARRIAQTEINTSTNFGIHDSYRQNDVEKKNWLSSRSENAREAHAALEKEIILMSQRFSNGLLYPGDPDGSAGEIINCNCTLLPKI